MRQVITKISLIEISLTIKIDFICLSVQYKKGMILFYVISLAYIFSPFFNFAILYFYFFYFNNIKNFFF